MTNPFLNIYKKILDKLKFFLNYLVAASDNEWHKNMYKYSKLLSVVLIVIAYSGVIYINPTYANLVHTFLLYYVCSILLIRFNPLIKKNYSATYTEFNRNVAFTASIILLTKLIAKNATDLFLIK